MLKFGVPQGSILGPLLYILYTKDIENIAKDYSMEVNMYADDCQLYISFSQNSVICKRCNIAFNSYANILYQLNIHSLQYRRVYFDIIFMFKIINGISGLRFNDFFVSVTRPYQLRQNESKIDVLNYYKNSTFHNSFFVRAAKFWNALPQELTVLKSLQTFKTCLKKLI